MSLLTLSPIAYLLIRYSERIRVLCFYLSYYPLPFPLGSLCIWVIGICVTSSNLHLQVSFELIPPLLWFRKVFSVSPSNILLILARCLIDCTNTKIEFYNSYPFIPFSR